MLLANKLIGQYFLILITNILISSKKSSPQGFASPKYYISLLLAKALHDPVFSHFSNSGGF
jgi:hypothetical protein